MKGAEQGPRYEREPTVKRRIAVAENPDAADQRYLTWRLDGADLEGEADKGEWGWSQLLAEHHVDLHKQLAEFEQTKIFELKKGKRLKSIGVMSICQRAKRRLKQLTYWQDSESLWELVLPGNRRVWGDLRQATFHVLWWDPDHSVCTGKSRAAGRSNE